MTRIAICGLWHETNTFAVSPTGQDDFHVLQGAEILNTLRGTRTPIGGFLESASVEGVEARPTVFAWALPSGTVDAPTYEALATRVVDETAAVRPDAVLMDLHGAMVAERCDDVEADLLGRLRRTLGSIPIGVVLDFHANTSAAFTRVVDIVTGYDTYPHVDPFERGLETAELLGRLLRGAIQPTRAWAQPPLLVPPQVQATSHAPMQDLMVRAHQAERDPAVLNVTVAAGFPYADVPCAGVSVVVTTNGTPDLAREVAEDLARAAWGAREAFRITQLPPDEAVAQALRSPDRPVVLVDSADNVGGGAPGDGTALLDALVRARAAGAVVTVVDPDVVHTARTIGEGGVVVAEVGGKSDPRYGRPVPIRGTVLRVCQSDFTYRGSYMTGRRVESGWAALLDVGGVLLVLRERKVMPFDQEELRVLGIDPAQAPIIVVKSAIAWRAAYEAIARAVIEVDTPGVCAANLRTLPYRRVRRPVVPLDEDVRW